MCSGKYVTDMYFFAGTWQLDGSVAEMTTYDAIKLGYRHIDTAEAYRNEGNIGWALYHVLQQGIVTRSDLFIATKLSDSEANGGFLPTQPPSFSPNCFSRIFQDQKNRFCFHQGRPIARRI